MPEAEGERDDGGGQLFGGHQWFTEPWLRGQEIWVIQGGASHWQEKTSGSRDRLVWDGGDKEKARGDKG